MQYIRWDRKKNKKKHKRKHYEVYSLMRTTNNHTLQNEHCKQKSQSATVAY